MIATREMSREEYLGIIYDAFKGKGWDFYKSSDSDEEEHGLERAIRQGPASKLERETFYQILPRVSGEDLQEKIRRVKGAMKSKQFPPQITFAFPDSDLKHEEEIMFLEFKDKVNISSFYIEIPYKQFIEALDSLTKYDANQ